MLVDTHCHLDAAEFDGDRDSVAQAALASGVGRIVIPAVERANFGAIASLCRDYSGCAAAYGIHPLYVDRAREEDLDALRETLQREQPLAVGEIGLDRHVEPRDDARQEYWFSAQLDMARERELPVLLHVRRAIDPVLKHLRRARVPGGIAHAFNGSLQQATMFIDLGFALGFGGAFTFTRALQIRRLVRDLPGHAHVLETDAPDIAPAWLAPGRNTPDAVAGIAQAFAVLRERPLAEVLATTGDNARRVLPRLVI